MSSQPPNPYPNPISTLFQTPHLTMRAVNDTPADLHHFHSIQSDIAAFSASDINLLRPWGRADTKKLMEVFADPKERLLCVIVCLNAELSAIYKREKERESGGNGNGEEKKKDKDGKDGQDEWGLVQDRELVPIGWVGLTAPHHHHRCSDISIDILAPFRGKGYGAEAINWVLDWGFRQANLHRVGIEHFDHNVGAGKLYRRLGFREEGLQRECFWYNGGWAGMWSLGMLEDEWRALREEKDWRKS